jgi:hypothetical protein
LKQRSLSSDSSKPKTNLTSVNEKKARKQRCIALAADNCDAQNVESGASGTVEINVKNKQALKKGGGDKKGEEKLRVELGAARLN